jgi:hypothetical protein
MEEGGIEFEFTLNQKPLGTLGKPGVVIRNAEISRKNLVASQNIP